MDDLLGLGGSAKRDVGQHLLDRLLEWALTLQDFGQGAGRGSSRFRSSAGGTFQVVW